MADVVLDDPVLAAATAPRCGQRVLDRRPDANEIDMGLTYLSGLRQKWNQIDEEKAWTSLTHALMASNEFIFVY